MLGTTCSWRWTAARLRSCAAWRSTWGWTSTLGGWCRDLEKAGLRAAQVTPGCRLHGSAAGSHGRRRPILHPPSTSPPTHSFRACLQRQLGDRPLCLRQPVGRRGPRHGAGARRGAVGGGAARRPDRSGAVPRRGPVGAGRKRDGAVGGGGGGGGGGGARAPGRCGMLTACCRCVPPAAARHRLPPPGLFLRCGCPAALWPHILGSHTSSSPITPALPRPSWRCLPRRPPTRASLARR